MTDKVQIFGSTACAACKTVVSVAKASGVAFDYHLINQDPEAAEAFAKFSKTAGSRALPLTVFGERVVSGLAPSLTLVKEVA